MLKEGFPLDGLWKYGCTTVNPSGVVHRTGCWRSVEILYALSENHCYKIYNFFFKAAYLLAIIKKNLVDAHY